MTVPPSDAPRAHRAFQSQMSNCDVIVLGAGIVGACCAREAAIAGLSVHIIDRGPPCGGTSRACTGLVSNWDKIPGPELDLGLLSRRLWAGIAEELNGGESFEWRENGVLVIAKDESQADSLRRLEQRMADLQPMESVDDPHRIEPALAPVPHGGLFFSQDAQLDPRRATVELLADARRRGVEESWEVGEMALIVEGGAVRGVRSQQGEWRADRVVIACGVWSPALLAPLGIPLGIVPRKGQVLVIESGPPLLQRAVMDAGYFDTVLSRTEALQIGLILEQTAHGSLLVGASREFVGFGREIVPAVIARLAQNAMQALPALKDRNVIRSYAGLRPATEDHLPFIGAVPGIEGLHVAAGHEGAGICLAPATGRLIAQMLAGEALCIDAAPFRLDRPTASWRGPEQ